MWERPARFPVNIKRRSVSAVRDFPKGCGIKVVPKPNTSPPVELGCNKDKEEADADVPSEASSSFKVPKEGPRDSNLGAESENGSPENGLKSESLARPESSSVVIEGVKINGHVENDSNPVDSVNLKPELDRTVTESGVKLEVLELPKEGLDWPTTGQGQGARVNGHVEEEASSSKQCVNGDLKEETRDSKRFHVIKRRKVSAVRDFPLGCGRVSKKADSEVGTIASSESKAFDERKKALSSCGKVDDEARMNGDVAREKVDDEVRKQDEKSVGEEVREMDGEAILKSPKDNTLDGEKKKPVGGGVAPTKKLEGEVKRNVSKQAKVEVREGNIKSTIKSSKGISSDADKKPLVKRREMVEGSDGASSAEMDEAESNQIQVFKSQDVKPSDLEKRKPSGVGVTLAKKPIDESKIGESRQNKAKVKNEIVIKSHKAKSLDGEKKSMEKQKEAMEGSDSVSSAEMVKTGAKDNETKKIRLNVPESTSKVRDKSPLTRSPNECLVEDHSKKKMLIQSTPEKKLDGRGVKQGGKNAQVKESQEARSPFEVRTVDKVGRSLVGKPVYKGPINRQEDGKHLKRKLAEEEGDDSMEPYADRVIVQALMSAENCPWRKGRKPSAVTPQSISSKFKQKNVKKALASKSASVSGRAASLYKDIVNVKDEEDSPPQDGGYEMTPTLYNRSRGLCITMTPSVPSGQVSKCGMNDEAVSRNMVKKTLRMFQLICRKLVQEEESSKGGPLRGDESKYQRVDLKAARILKESQRWVNHGEPIIGHVPGVEVGDEFHFRVELSIIGLHRPFQGGIDFTKKNGMVLATSIVSSGGYPDDTDSSDVLIYSGSGGNASGAGDKQAGDQKLERGNLALKNSIDAQTPVRVVYGSKELTKSDSQDAKPKLVTTFTYDGLYMVERYWPEMGNNGFNVFKFQLRRMPGQPEISLKEVKKTKKSKVREGLCVKDISDGKEKIPICAVNTADSDLPMPFKYITKVIYPSWHVQKPSRGCDCTDGCSDSEKCACAMKNGGEIPFNFNGAIVQAKPLVYECGPSCKCPPSCHNRVSQHGIRQPLEIFKTKSRGWGVRSLYSIPSGTFVCEYVGEMLEDADAEQRVNDEYLFDIGHNYDDHTLWEGLPGFIPGMQSDTVPETDSELKDVGFTIDAAEYGNVGRFINHSCSPNLYAQNLLYDHDNKKMPHVMFFAIDNIPPLQELTYHYNYTIDQVRDSAGNIKKKECLCGSPECTGRLY